MDETERRRAKQIAYNQRMGQQPRGIEKRVIDILEVPIPGAMTTGAGKRTGAKVAEKKADYLPKKPTDAAKRIKQLEEKMYAHARELEFEEAARLRDEIERIRGAMLVG